MRIIRIILLILVLVIVVALVGGFVLYNDTMRGPLPQTNGSLTVDGLARAGRSPARRLGHPAHLRQRSARSVLRAGLCPGAGSLVADGILPPHRQRLRLKNSRAKPTASFGTDVFIRTVGWRRTAEQEVRKMTDDERAALASLRRWRQRLYHQPLAPTIWRCEYRLLGVTGVNITIEPWTPADTLVWGKVMAWNLTDTYSLRTTRARRST